ncbi:MAG: hypothetical protein DWQ01_16985 [Planctomycetota bacterium]|nr:MAG: hypothetical protein DWQ01_16985 [Planctomycetota bacterium]
MSFPAQCDSCQSQYQVPDSNKRYRCKACGGTVQVVLEEVPQTPEEATCSACGEILQEGDQFCGSCGEPRPGFQPKPTASPRRKTGSRKAGSKTGSLGAAAQLRSVRSNVFFFRFLYGLTGLVNLGLLLYIIFNFVIPGFPFTFFWLAFLMLAVPAVLSVAGILLIPFQPLTWGLLLASLTTMGYLNYLTGEISSLGLIFRGAWTLLLWMAIIPLVRFRKLAQEFPELCLKILVSRKSRKRDDQGKNQNPVQLLKKAKNRAIRNAIIACALASTLIFGGSAVAYWGLRPPQFETAATEFIEGIRQNPLQAISEYARSDKASQAEQWEASMRSRNWHLKLPEVEDRTITGGVSSGTAVMDFGQDEKLITKWRTEGRHWKLISMSFPPPPYQQALEQWMEAWNRSDFAVLGSLFGPQKEKMMRDKLSSIPKIKDWGTEFPKATGHEWLPYGRESANLMIHTELGTFRLRWTVENDIWIAKSLKLP